MLWEMCELELMEILGILRLYRFTGVPIPGSGGWWLVSSGMDAERGRGGRGKEVNVPFRGFMQK